MEKEKISGVYKITNNIIGDCYIGSSSNIRNRWCFHKSPAAWAHLPNSKLYQDMAQYGLSNFTFEIIEITDNRVEREQYWISQLSPKYNSNRALRTEEERLEYHNKNYSSEICAPRIGNKGSPVLCIETGEIFDSAAEAARHVNRAKSGVVASIHLSHKCAGYTWRYLTQNEIDNFNGDL